MPIEIVLNDGLPVKIGRTGRAEAMQVLKNIASLPIVHPYVVAIPDVPSGRAPRWARSFRRKTPSARRRWASTSVRHSRARRRFPASVLGARTGRSCVPRSSAISRRPRAEAPAFDAAVGWMESHGPGDRLEALVDRALHHRGDSRWRQPFHRGLAWTATTAVILWAFFHSGSRNVERPRRDVHIGPRRKAMCRALGPFRIRIRVVDAGTRSVEEYHADLEWCQAYARQTARSAMDRLLRQLSFAVGLSDDVSRLGITVSVDATTTTSPTKCTTGTVAGDTEGRDPGGEGELGIIPGPWGPAPT